MSVVIDTNVAFVAEKMADHADQACVDSCINRLAEIVRSGRLLLDSNGAIIHEYMKTLGHKGQPGVGRAFVKWAFDNRFVGTRCTLISIKELDDGGWRQYEEFPDIPVLSAFDKSDQKFVAVAIASGVGPPIVNAVDSDWWNHREELSAAGVNLEFLCPHLHQSG